jgi:hypothetical protein
MARAESSLSGKKSALAWGLNYVNLTMENDIYKILSNNKTGTVWSEWFSIA